MEVNQSVLSRQFIEVSFIKVFYRRTSIQEVKYNKCFITSIQSTPNQDVVFHRALLYHHKVNVTQ